MFTFSWENTEVILIKDIVILPRSSTLNFQKGRPLSLRMQNPLTSWLVPKHVCFLTRPLYFILVWAPKGSNTERVVLFRERRRGVSPSREAMLFAEKTVLMFSSSSRVKASPNTLVTNATEPSPSPRRLKGTPRETCTFIPLYLRIPKTFIVTVSHPWQFCTHLGPLL